MSRINLSGIKALAPPASLFDEWTKYNESHLKESKWPEGCDVWADVVWEKDNPHQTEQEPALLVKVDNCPVGYIPVLSTIERYINEAWEKRGKAMAEGNAELANEHFRRWEKESERWKYAEIVRKHVEADLFISHVPSRVKIGNVFIDYYGNVGSVSVDYDDM